MGHLTEEREALDGSQLCPIEQLVATLQWGGGLPPSQGVYHDYCDVLFALREAMIERARQLCVAGAQKACDSIARLNDRGKERLTLAPETAHRLLRGICDAATISFIRSACEAELVAAGHESASADLWTALGDRYFPAGSGNDRLEGNRWDFDPQKPYAARTVGSIPVDFLSPYTRGISGANGQPGDDVSPGEARAVYKKVVAAKDLLEAIDPAIAGFVYREITTLIARSEGESNATGSSSSPRYIGRAILWNAHLPAVGVLDCAEQLLHEAIHCHAYRIELRTPFVTAASACGQVLSPWSTRSLSVYSFIHASFVWFGLANLWRAVLERGVIPEREVMPHLRQAVRGFLRDPLSTLSEARSCVAEPVLKGLDKMQRATRDLWGGKFKSTNPALGAGL